MSHINVLRVKNFKAISEFEADFKGCSAIVIGGNNKGKTSFLKGLIERIRFNRPDIIVKQGEEEGSQEMVLDTKEKFIWEYDKDGYDKLTYVSEKGVRKSVTTELGKRFFPESFDVDTFLASSPKEQSRMLQKQANMDFTEIDTRYKEAYDFRTKTNAEAERYHVKLTKMLEVPKVDFVDLTKLKEKKEAERLVLNNLYLKNKAHNDALRKEWQAANEKLRAEIELFNSEQQANQDNYTSAFDALKILASLGYVGTEVNSFIEGLKKKVLDVKTYAPLAEPAYITEMPNDATLQAIDAEILSASEINSRAQSYKDYIDHKNMTEAAQALTEEADLAVKAIEQEREEMIRKANFPTGVSLSSDGVTVDGLPFNREQLSTSKLYITALKIGSMKLGEVKTLYFDASFLDKNSLAEIEKWAAAFEPEPLQLLIERPDFEGGEIKYQLIEKL